MNLMESFKIIKEFASVYPDELFTLNVSRNLHGDPITLSKQWVLISAGQQPFEVRVEPPLHWGRHGLIDRLFKARVYGVWQDVSPQSL